MKRVLSVIAIALVSCALCVKANAQSTSERSSSSSSSEQAAATPLTGTSGTSDVGASRATSDAPSKSVSTVPVTSISSDTATKTDQKAGSTTDGNSTKAGSGETSNANTSTTTGAGASSALMNIYRVGVGDILDIRLASAKTRESTLYTVLTGGLIEYPLAGDPLPVSGLTTDEIAASLSSRLKVFDYPKVTVTVREYASHNVIVTGLVNDPGSKVLRREAVPLYVVLTEAQPRPDAGRATIMRAGNRPVTVDLSDTAQMNSLVYPGDVIKVLAAPPQFFYIGGQIASPGQKSFHTGITLTQAIMASGGATRFAASEAKVLRQGSDGRLVTTKYNLKKIEKGEIPDPELQPGDRIEISRSGW